MRAPTATLVPLGKAEPRRWRDECKTKSTSGRATPKSRAAERRPEMSALSSQWDTIRRLADELELRMHLARMDARDRWNSLKPRLRDLENTLAASGKRAGDAIDREVAALGQALERLRQDVNGGSDD
jgi:hypothetical protein